MEKHVLEESALELGDVESSDMLVALEWVLGKRPVHKESSTSYEEKNSPPPGVGSCPVALWDALDCYATTKNHYKGAGVAIYTISVTRKAEAGRSLWTQGS